MCHTLFIHSSADGYLGGCHIWATVNHAAMGNGVPIFLRDPAFNSFGHTFRSGTARSHIQSIFKLGGHYHTVFHNSCTMSEPHPQRTRVPMSPHSHQHLSFFFFNSHHDRYEVILPCGLICISWWLVALSGIWPFQTLVGHLYVFSGEISTQILSPFLIELLGFCCCCCLLLRCRSTLYILEVNPLSDIFRKVNKTQNQSIRIEAITANSPVRGQANAEPLNCPYLSQD